MNNCQHCNHPNEGGWFYCKECGQRAHAPGAAVAAGDDAGQRQVPRGTRRVGKGDDALPQGGKRGQGAGAVLRARPLRAARGDRQVRRRRRGRGS